jgi:hypothetical protein
VAAPNVQTTATDSGSSSPLTVSVPSGTSNGDLLLLVVGADLNASETSEYTVHENWTELLAKTRSHASNAGCNLQVWYKTASSEPASYDVGLDHGNLTGASIIRIDGHDSGDPFSVSQITAYDDSTEGKVPSVTTDRDDCLIVAICQWDQSKTLNSVPSGWSEVLHIDVSGLDQHVIQKDLASQGATGVGQYDLSSDSPHVGATIAVQPSADAPAAAIPVGTLPLMGV